MFTSFDLCLDLREVGNVCFVGDDLMLDASKGCWCFFFSRSVTI